MQLFTSLRCAVLLAGAPVLAEIVVFGVPAIIKPGQPFNASFQNAIQQPSQYTIVWGYTPYDKNTPPAYMPQHNTVGEPIGTVNYGGKYDPTCLFLGFHHCVRFLRNPPLLTTIVDYLAVAEGGWNGNITGLIVEGNVGDQVGIHAMIWGEYGVLNYATIHSWLWNVTLGTATSLDNYIMVEAEQGTPNFEVFNL